MATLIIAGAAAPAAPAAPQERRPPAGGWELGIDITCTNGTERFPGLGLEADFTIRTGSLGAAYNVPFTPLIWPYLRVAAGQAQLDRLAAQE